MNETFPSLFILTISNSEQQKIKQGTVNVKYLPNRLQINHVGMQNVYIVSA